MNFVGYDYRKERADAEAFDHGLDGELVDAGNY